MNLYFRRFPVQEYEPHCRPTPCTWVLHPGNLCGRDCQYEAWTNDPQAACDFYCTQHLFAVMGRDWDKVTELRSREAHLTERDARYILALDSLPVRNDNELKEFIEDLEMEVGYYGEEYVAGRREWNLDQWEYLKSL